MIDRLMRVLAFGLLTVFLGILVYRVPRLDLGALVLVTLSFCAYDLFVPQRRGR
jgi:hypothetical protein